LQKKDITFSSIVDIDDEAFESYVSEDLAGRLGEGDFFRMMMLILIVLNSVLIGLETDDSFVGIFFSLSTILYSFASPFNLPLGFLSIHAAIKLFKLYYIVEFYLSIFIYHGNFI
jgi:hypothetical protein